MTHWSCDRPRRWLPVWPATAEHISALLFIKRHIKLTRYVIFAAVADEERHGSKYGTKCLVENYPEFVHACACMRT